MGVIDFNPTIRDLIKFAGTAINDGKYLMCVQNLDEALQKAATKEDKAIVYKCFADMYNNSGNIQLAKNMLFRGCVESDKGGYYCIDFQRFFPDDAIFEEEDAPVIDSDTILGYNDVYNYFLTGQYDKGLDILCELPPDTKSLDEIMNVLNVAIESGKKIDLSKHTYKLLLLAGIFAMKSGDFVRLMLQGGESSRAIMVEGAQFFADEIDDIRVLSRIGEAFVAEEEFDCAEMCFKKVLEISEIDPTALFYLAAVNYYRNKIEEGDGYWNKFKLCMRTFDAPIDVYERLFAKKIIPAFPRLLGAYIKEDLTFFQKEFNSSMIPEEYLKPTKNVLAFAPDSETVFSIGAKIDITDEKVFEVIKSLLISPFVGDEHKKWILGLLLHCGYEGRIAVAFEKKGIITDLVKFRHRGSKVWNIVYETVCNAIICSEEFLPLKVNFLSVSIKKLAKQCETAKISVTIDDAPFLCEIVAQNYNLRAKDNTNIGWIPLLPPLRGEELRKGLKKFPPEVIVF